MACLEIIRLGEREAYQKTGYINQLTKTLLSYNLDTLPPFDFRYKNNTETSPNVSNISLQKYVIVNGQKVASGSPISVSYLAIDKKGDLYVNDQTTLAGFTESGIYQITVTLADGTVFISQCFNQTIKNPYISWLWTQAVGNYNVSVCTKNYNDSITINWGDGTTSTHTHLSQSLIAPSLITHYYTERPTLTTKITGKVTYFQVTGQNSQLKMVGQNELLKLLWGASNQGFDGVTQSDFSINTCTQLNYLKWNSFSSAQSESVLKTLYDNGLSNGTVLSNAHAPVDVTYKNQLLNRGWTINFNA